MNYPRYRGLDTSEPKTLDILGGVQATILKGHGRKYGVLLFFVIGSDLASVATTRKFLGHLEVTTAASQLSQIRAFKVNETSGDTIVRNVVISYEGFRRLNVSPSQIPRDVAFRDGMKLASSARLKETNVATWQKEFRQTLHGCILLASSSEQALEVARTALDLELRTAVGPGGGVFSERCYVRSDAGGRVVEHFGFADGISQPLFFKDEVDEYSRGVGTNIKYDPSADPFRLALVQEPAGVGGGYGSYLAFRKIAQDVVGFQSDLAKLATETRNTEALAGALVVGRRQDGTPLVYGSQVALPKHENDNFDYTADSTGRYCPLQSHIRKSNPRLIASLDRRIARRGMSYGDEGGERGLMFMAFQADLTQQFEFLQGRWANSAVSAEDAAVECGVDALTGVYSMEGAAPHSWPSPWDAWAANVRVPFGGRTRVRGGEYFYAPSIGFLKSIGN